MELMTVEEVAELLRMRKETIRRLLTVGKLPGVRVGRSWRVPKDALITQLRRRTVTAPGGSVNAPEEAPAPLAKRRVVPVVRK